MTKTEKRTDILDLCTTARENAEIAMSYRLDLPDTREAVRDHIRAAQKALEEALRFVNGLDKKKGA